MSYQGPHDQLDWTALSHTAYYFVDGKQCRFMAETIKETFFTLPYARFIFADRTVTAIWNPMTREMKLSENPFPFPIQFKLGVGWETKGLQRSSNP